MGTQHNPRLDGLRAVAALAVVAWHCAIPEASGGSLGVDVFFVLSGWLITGILLGEIERAGSINWQAFMARRTTRLLPALCLMVATVVALDHGAWALGLAATTYTMNFATAARPNDNIFAHTWSLATEFQFYLVWPFVVAALAKLDRKRATLILVAAWLAMTVFREGARMGGAPWSAVYCLPIFHSTGLLLGSAAAFSPWRPRLGWLGLAGVIALFIGAQTHCAGADPAMKGAVATGPIALTEMLALLVILAPPRVLALPGLPWLGRISYGVYLWHFPLMFALAALPIWPRFCLVLLWAIALGAASYYLVERPMSGRRQLKERLAASYSVAGV